MNLRWWERVFRFALGILLIAWAIAGGPWWTFAGLYPLASAAWGFCPFYWLLRVSPSE
jgi:hypothetical protein